MRRLALLVAAVGLLTLLPALPSQAGSGDRTLPISDSTWYWREQQPVSGAPAQPPMLDDPSVPAGDLPVANGADPTQPDKVSLLAFDLGDLPASPSVSSFRLTLPLDPAATAGQAYASAAPPQLIACAVAGPWIGGSPGRPFSTKPADDCSVRVPGAFDEAKAAWTFDLTPLARRWLDPAQNHGLVVLPDPSAQAPPYQVVFGPAQAVSAAVAWSDGALPAPVLSAPLVPGTSAVVASQPRLQVQDAPPALEPAVPASGPAIAPAPAVAAAQAPVHLRPAAALRPRGALARTSAVALLGLLVLLMCSLSVAAPRTRGPRANVA